MSEPQPHDELLELLAELTAGELSDAQIARLEVLLRDNPQAQRRYLEHLSLHARLHLAYARGSSRDHMPGLSFPSEAVALPSPFPEAQLRRTRLWRALSLSAALVFAVLVAGVIVRQALMRDGLPGETASGLPDDDGVAVLTKAVCAVWKEPDEGGESLGNAAVGTVLRPRRLRLASGLVQLEFYSGATVVLEGPADFEIMSSMKAICRAGCLRAHVPHQAQGFQIGTPHATVVDLGTEFGVRVEPTGQAEVHVFVGKVQVLPESSPETSQPQRYVSAGSGLRIDASDSLKEIPLSEAGFVTTAELQQQAARNAEAHLEHWRAASKRLERDSRVLLYYTFEEQKPWDRMLDNRAPTAAPHALDGAIVGCQWSVGRWPEKAALDFKRPSDRIRIQGPIHCDSMTFAAWIRLDALQEAISALLSTDRYEEGNPHWQITQQGQLALGVSHADRTIRSRNKYLSPPVFGPDQLGNWTHVATVYDHSKGLVTHYVNGLAVSRQGMIARLPLRIEAAEIGNWVVPRETGAEPIRNFNGRIDEFLLFGEALDPREIRQIFEAGRMDDLPRNDV